jgi:hypothetical protein
MPKGRAVRHEKHQATKAIAFPKSGKYRFTMKTADFTLRFLRWPDEDRSCLSRPGFARSDRATRDLDIPAA